MSKLLNWQNTLWTGTIVSTFVTLDVQAQLEAEAKRRVQRGARQHKQTISRKVLVEICGGTGYNNTTKVGPTLTNASCRQNTMVTDVWCYFPADYGTSQSWAKCQSFGSCVFNGSYGKQTDDNGGTWIHNCKGTTWQTYKHMDTQKYQISRYPGIAT